MVYGIVRLINFAHGDVFMVGAFLAFYAVERFHLPLPAVFALAAGGSAVLAVVIERVAYRSISPRSTRSSDRTTTPSRVPSTW